MKEESSPSLTSDGFYFHSTFENGTDGWTERGEKCQVFSSKQNNYKGSYALSVINVLENWDGAQFILSTSQFKPNKTYSFSVMAMPEDTTTFLLQLEYTNTDGERCYETIAKASCGQDEWVQLENTAFRMPDYSNQYSVILIVNTDDPTGVFYIDDAVGGPEGAKYKAYFPESEYLKVVSQLNSYRKSHNLEPLTYKELTESEKNKFYKKAKEDLQFSYGSDLWVMEYQDGSFTGPVLCQSAQQLSNYGVSSFDLDGLTTYFKKEGENLAIKPAFFSQWKYISIGEVVDGNKRCWYIVYDT